MMLEDFVKKGDVASFRSGAMAKEEIEAQKKIAEMNRKRAEEHKKTLEEIERSKKMNEAFRLKMEQEEEIKRKKERKDVIVKTVGGLTLLSLFCGIVAVVPAEKKEAVKDYLEARAAVEAEFSHKYNDALREQKAANPSRGGSSHAGDGFVAGVLLSGTLKGGLAGMAVGSLFEDAPAPRADVSPKEVMNSPVDLDVTKSSWGIEKYTKSQADKPAAQKRGYVPTKAERILRDFRAHKDELIEQRMNKIRAERQARKEKEAQQAAQQKAPSKTLQQQLDSLDEQGMDNFAYTLKTDAAVKDTTAKTTVSPIVLANRTNHSR